MEVQSVAEYVERIRRGLKLNQQCFAELLGVTVVTVSRWETGAAIPKGLSAVLLNLLSNVVKLHASQTILDSLRRVATDPTSRMRVLVWLERHPSIPQLPPVEMRFLRPPRRRARCCSRLPAPLGAASLLGSRINPLPS